MSTAALALRACFCMAVVWLCACGDMGAGQIDEACTSNADCAENELCATGLCEGGLGECVARPETCNPDTVTPVCGCDGLTYQSRCFADQAGVRLATATACNCADDSSCVEGQFCDSDTSCINPGFCAEPPQSCEPVSEPVCGCDGNTYASACEAAAASVRVSAQGSCECDANDGCEPTEYCNANVCEGPGVCELRDDSDCMPRGPVDGCNGIVYEDECAAARDGVRVRPE